MQSRVPWSWAAAVFAVLLAWLTLMLSTIAVALPVSETVIHTFAYGKLGATPIAPLIFDSAGNLYGTTDTGGTYNLGTVFELSPKSGGGWAETVLHTFSGTDGANPYAGLVFDTSGNLYGTAAEGGAAGYGVVFELTPTAGGGWTENVLYNFAGGSDGSFPTASLILDSKGDLYGTTLDGGTGCDGFGCGTVFEMTPNGSNWTETLLYTFTGGSDGSEPHASLLFDADGNLYGATVNGGQSGKGVVYTLTPNGNGGWTESVLHSFLGGNDGGYPWANLIFDASGDLYGTTGNGTIFELAPEGGGIWAENVLYAFSSTNSENYILAGVIFDQAGNLYGATYSGGTDKFCQGCGLVFELTPSNQGQWSETTIHTFNGRDGKNPYASLVFDTTGNVFGTAGFGGPGGNGSVFELKPKAGTWTENVINSFRDVDGQDPRAGLVVDSAGSLYGTTRIGGAHNMGAVFELSPAGSGWKGKILYSLKGGKDGAYPYGGLIIDSKGNLYGTTAGGGTHLDGTVFELSPTSSGNWRETVLHSFSAYGGISPLAGLIFDQSGNLYGTTVNGGVGGVGTVFELKHSKGRWTESVLYSFCKNCGNGSLPAGSLIFDGNGNLYGTTQKGGVYNIGVVFKLSPKPDSAWAETVLYSFKDPQGGSPQSGLSIDSGGNLYGTTLYGGNGFGTVFELSPTGGGWMEKAIYEFSGGGDGSYPYSGLVLDSTGDLYGTTNGGGGGECDCGTVFELSPSEGGWAENTLLSFNGADGNGPYAGLIFDAAGDLYGTTSSASVGAGVVFEITP